MEPGRRDREQLAGARQDLDADQAAMEPGRRDREQTGTPGAPGLIVAVTPQWSPVDVTGNSFDTLMIVVAAPSPQWSPVDVTGNSRRRRAGRARSDRCRNGARST